MADKDPYSADDIKRRKRKFDSSIDNRAPKMGLQSDQCYILVAEDIRRIFIWKGAKSPVRKRFISARIAQELQKEILDDSNLRCKIVSVDEGNEPEEFDAWIMEHSDDEELPFPSILKSTKRDEIIKNLKNSQIPEGLERELIIIGQEAYTIVEKVHTIQGKKQVTKEIFKVEIPDGVFLLDYKISRIFYDKILVVEFFRPKKKPSDFFTRLRKFPVEKKDGDDDDEPPYPFIFKPPTAPGDLGLTANLQVKIPLVIQLLLDPPNCKHCGNLLSEGESICPSCRNKVI